MKVPSPVPQSQIKQAVAVLVEERDVHTPEQHLARSRLWVEYRDDPSVNLAEMTSTQLALVAREPRLVDWLTRDPDLRDWLTSPREMEEHVESLFGQFIEGLQWRRASMSDKDYIQAMKLIAEVGNRMPQRWAKEKVLDEGVGKMGDAQRKQLLIDTLKGLGYTVVAPGALPTAGGSDT